MSDSDSSELSRVLKIRSPYYDPPLKMLKCPFAPPIDCWCRNGKLSAIYFPFPLFSCTFFSFSEDRARREEIYIAFYEHRCVWCMKRIKKFFIRRHRCYQRRLGPTRFFHRMFKYAATLPTDCITPSPSNIVYVPVLFMFFVFMRLPYYSLVMRFYVS